MRGKAQKIYYYVLVFTDDGPIYVTKLGDGKTAYWDKLEKPLELSKNYAEQMALGLTWNGSSAVCVSSLYEIDSQPYVYEYYSIQFVENENDEDYTDED